MKVSRKPLRVPIRPPASDEYDSFLREYISSPPDVRLDLIQSTRAVDDFLILLNSSVHTLCHIRVDRQKDGSKELTGVTGNSQNFYVFRVDAKVAVQNFGAATNLAPDDEELPEGVDCGRPLRQILTKKKSRQRLKKQLLEDLFEEGSLPEDEDQDVLPFFLPVAFPSSRTTNPSWGRQKTRLLTTPCSPSTPSSVCGWRPQPVCCTKDLPRPNTGSSWPPTVTRTVSQPPQTCR